MDVAATRTDRACSEGCSVAMGRRLEMNIGLQAAPPRSRCDRHPSTTKY